jgi:DNA-directed RNA polymerase specialized sigma24 family protein
MEGMDNKQVAAILQKTVGSVKSLQHRGLASLERVLKQGPAKSLFSDISTAEELGLE